MNSTPTLVTGTRLIVLTSALILAAPAHAANEALMELFKIMRDKGSLDQNEYELLVNAAKADAEKTERDKLQEREQVDVKLAAVEERTSITQNEVREEVDVKLAAVDEKTDKMKWTEKIKLQGDLRTRYEYQDGDVLPDERSRGRLRYRLGVIGQPIDRVEVGAGLASGGPDPRSTNQTFDNTFSTKDIRLDYAYMQYAFGNQFDGLTAIAGKFKRKKFLWAPTDVMWDSDLNPEGVSFNYMGDNAWGTYFANTGVWVIEEQAASSDDPFLVFGQLGQSWKKDDWFGTLGGAIYSFSNIKDLSDITFGGFTNTSSNLSSFNLAGEVGTGITDGKLSLIGEYIYNFETHSPEDTAWALGTKVSWNKWDLKYLYADVESNAVPDFTPDSDRFNGLTGFDGHEVELTYALMKNIKIGVDYYNVSGDVFNDHQEVVQADLNVKF